ncbi:MAG: PKD domain-containing protein [Myxococcales bacterium]|jgi:PKD repeat protein
MRNLVLTSCALLALAGCKRPGPPAAVATAPAGPVPVGAVVVLDGSASSDPQGRALQFQWKLTARPAGSTAEIADPTLATAWLTPDVEGPYEARLVASNGVLTSEAAVPFTVQCGAAAPVVALTATPQEAATGELVQIEGSFTDADLEEPCGQRQLHTLSWSLVGAPAGSAAHLSATEGAKPFLTPDLPGTYRVQLAITDSTGRAGQKTVELTARECGVNAPIIVALSADPATVGARVQVRAMALDPDSAPPCSRPGALTYAWRFAARPATSAARFDNRRLASPSFLPDVAGTYVVELAVTDPTRRTARGQLSIDVSGCGASAPSITAVAPSPAAPNVGQVIELSAAVEDPDNAAPCSSSQLFGLKWSLVGLPAGSAAALSDPQALRPWFKADVAGEYRLTVEAFDDTGRASAPFALSLQVSACGSGVPLARIEMPAAAGVGRPVQAVARVSDADATAPCSSPESFRYAWSFAALPRRSTALLNGVALSAPSFVPDVAGDYVLRLVVTDSAGHRSAPAFATVAVAACGANPPIAAASATPAAPNPGQPVLLSASATDPDNDAFCLDGQSVSWQWAFESLPAGSRAALSSSTARQPSFAPDVAGDYVVRLVASDSTGRSSEPARVTVSATSCGGAAPVASASAQPSAPAIGQAVRLRGAVADADNDAHCLAGQSFTYGWSFESLPAGSRAVLDDAAALAPSFAPDLPGEYVLRLVAVDSTGNSSAPARVSVTASGCSANAPVAAVAADPASAHVGKAIRLVPAVSDSDNEPVCSLPMPQSFSYAWALLSAPAGSTAQLSDNRAREPSFVADFPGDYTARLIVTDSAGLSSRPADVTVSVHGCGANAPVILSADAHPMVSAVGQTVELRAAFQDADDGAECQSALGTPFSNTFAWRVLSAPAASAAAITGADRLVAGFVPDVPGAYQLEITVTDPTGRSDAKTAALTVTACGAAAPTVAPAVDPISRAHVNGFIVLHSNAQDADIQIPCGASQHLDFQWWFQELPAGSRARFDDATRRDASFVPDAGGSYVVAVAATDSTGRRSAVRTASVEVDPCGGKPPVAQLTAALEGGPTFGPSADLAQIVIPACVRVLLDGSPSFDPDVACGLPQASDSLGYQWQLVSTPAGATNPLQGSAAASRSFDPQVPSSLEAPYVVELKVSDGMLESAPARVALVTESFEITSIDPAMACEGNVPAQLTLNGKGFLRVAGFEPTIRFEPPGVQAGLVRLAGCAPTHCGIESCTELVVEVPPGAGSAGAHTVTVTNPVGEACSASAVFSVGPPPIVAAVSPRSTCAGQASFAIEGSGFGPATVVRFNAAPADRVAYATASKLAAGFDDLVPGLYDVTASSGAGCAATLKEAVAVLPGPSVHAVYPEIVSGARATLATLSVSGINGASVSWVGIRPAGSADAFRDLRYAYDPQRPDQVRAVIPAGLAVGRYEIGLRDGDGCSARLAGAFTVTEQETLAVRDCFGSCGRLRP